MYSICQRVSKSFVNQRSSFLLLVICATALIQIAPLNAEESEFKVMSFNIRYDNPRDGVNRWSNRRDQVAELIASHDLDILGMQEVVSGQFDFLAKKLTKLEPYGVGRDDGKRKGEFSPIFFRKDRFELLDKGTFWLSEKPQVAGSKSWDAAITRICSWVKLKDRKSKRELFAFNTHFDHRGKMARKNSAILITKMVSQIAGEHPIVLTGDFNCLETSSPYASIVSDKNKSILQDALKVSKSKPTGPNSTWCGFKKVVDDRRIDFVFTSRNIQVAAHAIIDSKISEDRFPSDHLPVVATLKIND